MTTPETPDTQVFRPSPAARQRTILWGLIPAIPLLFITVTNSVAQPRSAPVYLGVLLVTAVLITVFLIWYVRVTRLEFGGGRYRYVTTFLRREFTVDDVERVVAVDELHYGLNGARALFIAGRVRRRLLRMNSVAWDTPQLEAVINDLVARGVPLTHVAGRLTPGEFHRREPGLLWWFEAHRVAFILILVAAMLLLVVVVIVVLLAVLASAAVVA